MTEPTQSICLSDNGAPAYAVTLYGAQVSLIADLLRNHATDNPALVQWWDWAIIDEFSEMAKRVQADLCASDLGRPCR